MFGCAPTHPKLQKCDLSQALLGWLSQVCLRPSLGFPGSSAVINLPAVQEIWVPALSQEDALEKELATHFSILAWEIHGQRSPVGYSPWVHKESDRT